MPEKKKCICLVPCIFILILCFSLACNSCSGSFSSLEGFDAVKITTYNIQTFFDSITVGTEYDDYKGSKSSWSEEKYKVRIGRLCSIIESIDADIFVFQEIENASVLQDISNNLKTQSDTSRCFSHAVFVPSRDGALGCAILSRFPILSCTSHQIDFRSLNSSPPDMRPLLEVRIHCGFSSPLTIYAGHWKSKAGSSVQSNDWRSAQEEVLSSRIMQLKDELYIFCGDCNKDISEFYSDGDQVLLGRTETSFVHKRESFVKASSPWLFSKNNSLEGSYYFQEKWEKIDHFFLGSALEAQSFSLENKGSHVNDERIPIRYTVWNGAGYSDHLPLSCYIIEKK